MRKKEEDAEKKSSVLLATSEANRAGEALNNPKVEEEWKIYEEEKKDFSNLKIETLRVDTDEEVKEEEEHEINEETGEKVRIKKGDNTGPWNKVAGTGAKKESSPVNDNDQKPAPAKKEEESVAPKAPSRYVPPNMRAGASGGDSERRGPGGRTRFGKNAPDLNTMNFPSLSDTAGGKDGSKIGGLTPRNSEEKDFETARGGGRQEARIVERPALSLDNKFSALRN